MHYANKKRMALVINEIDNVAVAITDLSPGEIVTIKGKNGLNELKVLDNVPKGHKIATRDIKKGAPIIKYGEKIGIASTLITKGKHVHIHNIKSTLGG